MNAYVARIIGVALFIVGATPLAFGASGLELCLHSEGGMHACSDGCGVPGTGAQQGLSSTCDNEACAHVAIAGIDDASQVAASRIPLPDVSVGDASAIPFLLVVTPIAQEERDQVLHLPLQPDGVAHVTRVLRPIVLRL